MEPNEPTAPDSPAPTPPRPVMDMLPKTRRTHPHHPHTHITNPVAESPVVESPAPVPEVESNTEPQPEPAIEQTVEELPPPEEPSEDQPKRPRSKLVIIAIIIAILVVAGIGGAIGVNTWYQAQLQPMTNDKNAPRIRVTINPGSTPEQIAALLKEKGLIRDVSAFMYYTRDKGVQGKLQAGSFSLKPSDSLAAIVDHLVAGKTDEFSLTFLPGDVLEAHRTVLIKAGYTPEEVDAALGKSYDHPLFAGKPPTANLEGYIYGETYNFTGDATVEQILTRTFDEMQEQVKDYDLINAYKKQGLTLYQAITLASIIQREVKGEADEKQVAQIFLKRLREGGALGSDVTYIYIAKKLGLEATPDLDSPYNTRKYPGLPPGPISSPGLSALLAVANPAPGDYTYFLAGDDGKTYFAHTYAEHESNIVNHCQKNCSL